MNPRRTFPIRHLFLIAAVMLATNGGSLRSQVLHDWLKQSETAESLTIVTQGYARAWADENKIATSGRLNDRGNPIRPAALITAQQEKFNLLAKSIDWQALTIHWVKYQGAPGQGPNEKYIEIWYPYADWAAQQGQQGKAPAKPADEFERKRYLDAAVQEVRSLDLDIPARGRVAIVAPFAADYDFAEKSVYIRLGHVTIHDPGTGRGDFGEALDSARKGKKLLERTSLKHPSTVGLSKDDKIQQLATLRIDETEAEFIVKHCGKEVVVFAEGPLRTAHNLSGVFRIEPDSFRIIALPAEGAPDQAVRALPESSLSW